LLANVGDKETLRVLMVSDLYLDSDIAGDQTVFIFCTISVESPDMRIKGNSLETGGFDKTFVCKT
jgi:hypothetical protein